MTRIVQSRRAIARNALRQSAQCVAEMVYSAVTLSTRDIHLDNQLSVLQRWCIATFLDYRMYLSNAWLSLYSLAQQACRATYLCSGFACSSIKLCCQITCRYQHCGNVMLSISLTRTYTLLQGISRVLVCSSVSAYHHGLMVIPYYSYDDCFEYLFILCLLFG